MKVTLSDRERESEREYRKCTGETEMWKFLEVTERVFIQLTSVLLNCAAGNEYTRSDLY